MDINNLCQNCMTEYEGGMCPHCRHMRNERQDNTHALKPYTILSGKYLVGNVIGEGGFGITYIGFDLNLEVKIAIKEYYPNGFVTRESDVTSVVTQYTTNDPEQFQKWKDSFVREARNLAKFSNLPGIVHVRDFFQENNTAYIIMEYVEGETLKAYLKDRGTPMSVEEVLELMEPVIKSLSKVHDGGIIHRDISPDNIMIQEGGDIKLIDFGAAREFESGNEKSMSVLLKPGYAPEEQYRTRGEQGPWTDVYALCATMYRCITGVKPIESMERMRDDDLKKPSDMGVEISPKIENSIMNGMEIYAENRIKDMKALHEALYRSQREYNYKPAAESVIYEKNISADINTKLNSIKKNATKLWNNKQGKIAVIVTSGLLLVLVILLVGRSTFFLNQNSTSSVSGDTGSDRGPFQPEPNTGSDRGPFQPKPDTGSDRGPFQPITNYLSPEEISDEPASDPEISTEPTASIADKEKYMHEYKEIVGEYWNDSDHRNWDLRGIEIINFNSNDSDTPEVLVLWDPAKEGIMAQTIFGADCKKNYHAITSSSVYDYNLELYKGSDGSTLAYTINEGNNYYLVDSNDSKPFALYLANDEDFDYSVRDEYVGRVPSVFSRASNTPGKWSPDESVYYRVYWDEMQTVLYSLISGRDKLNHYYTDCFISFNYNNDEKDLEWENAWDRAWDKYTENWEVKE